MDSSFEQSDRLAFHGFVSNFWHDESTFSQKSGVVALGIAGWNVLELDGRVRVVVDSVVVTVSIIAIDVKTVHFLLLKTLGQVVKHNVNQYQKAIIELVAAS